MNNEWKQIRTWQDFAIMCILWWFWPSIYQECVVWLKQDWADVQKAMQIRKITKWTALAELRKKESYEPN